MTGTTGPGQRSGLLLHYGATEQTANKGAGGAMGNGESPFKKATKHEAKLRFALIGPAGAGKTYTALRVAQVLAQGGTVALVDTERGSASKYAGEFDFDVVELDNFHPQRYIDMIAAAGKAGYSVLIIDSLSHAWMGPGGALQLVDEASKRSKGNSYVAWRDVTPLHNKLVDAIVGSPMHVLVTMRAKMEYVQEKDEKTGKTVVRKVGLQPVQREGLEYEFDVIGDLDQENNLIIGKTRCSALNGAVFYRAGAEVAETLLDWLQGPPVEAVPEPSPSLPTICSDCEQPIGDYLNMSAPAVANRSLERYGRALCAWCAQKAKMMPEWAELYSFADSLGIILYSEGFNLEDMSLDKCKQWERAMRKAVDNRLEQLSEQSGVTLDDSLTLPEKVKQGLEMMEAITRAEMVDETQR